MHETRIRYNKEDKHQTHATNLPRKSRSNIIVISRLISILGALIGLFKWERQPIKEKLISNIPKANSPKHKRTHEIAKGNFRKYPSSLKWDRSGRFFR